jgi:hypothetical protein
MLVSNNPPPLLFGHLVEVADARELCYPGSGMECVEQPGLSGDPFGITDVLTDVLTTVGNYFVAKKIAGSQDKATKLETQKLKAQREEDAREFARQQAEALVEPYETARMVQIAVLAGIGLAGAAVSIMFVRAALERR